MKGVLLVIVGALALGLFGTISGDSAHAQTATPAAAPMVFTNADGSMEAWGSGSWTAPAFTNSDAFRFCWGVTTDDADAGGPPMGGDYFAFYLNPMHPIVASGLTTTHRDTDPNGNVKVTINQTTQSSGASTQPPVKLVESGQGDASGDSGCVVKTVDAGSYAIHIVADRSAVWHFMVFPM